MRLLRNEYPRPQFRRDDWMPLNGEWEFCFDDKREGVKKGYPAGKTALGKKINVPFSYQYEASGIGDEEVHKTLWYKRNFTLPAGKERALLCFNGCGYTADVWVNGHHAITHKGTFAPFSCDVTDSLTAGENTVVVRCVDEFDPSMPRGKQSWTGKRFGCWYIPNSGIWQSVWLEFFGSDCIEKHTLTPDIDTCSFSGEITSLYGLADEAEITVTFRGETVKKLRFSTDGKRTPYCVRLFERDSVDESHYWTCEKPNLFYADFKLYRDGKCVDTAHTRFGMRKISVDEHGIVCLNNKPIYQRLILDQGYWAESGLTPPSAEALKTDIELSIKMGFNGARKHQKFEDPYFYYYAEELGFLTWCEMPSAYRFDPDEQAALLAEWQEIVASARNFTSNVCYVPLNESWGVRKILLDENQQNFARAMYFATKSVDSSRLVSTNDGWENSDATDLVSVHDYSYSGKNFTEKYSEDTYEALYPQGRKLLSYGVDYVGLPVLFTEFGGIAMSSEVKNGNWGYNSAAENAEEFFKRYEDLFAGLSACKFQGFCYTQLTDVQQEVNGLLRPDRTPKFDVERIRKITAQKIVQ